MLSRGMLLHLLIYGVGIVTILTCAAVLLAYLLSNAFDWLQEKIREYRWRKAKKGRYR